MINVLLRKSPGVLGDSRGFPGIPGVSRGFSGIPEVSRDFTKEIYLGIENLISLVKPRVTKLSRRLINVLLRKSPGFLGDSRGFSGIPGDSRGFPGFPGVSRGISEVGVSPEFPGKSNSYSGNRRLIARCGLFLGNLLKNSIFLFEIAQISEPECLSNVVISWLLGN